MYVSPRRYFLLLGEDAEELLEVSKKQTPNQSTFDLERVWLSLESVPVVPFSHFAPAHELTLCQRGAQRNENGLHLIFTANC